MTIAKNGRWALLCAIGVGVIAVLPTLLAALSLGEGYRGVQFMGLDDEDIYRSMIHEVFDGHPEIASPYLYEYKDASAAVMPPLFSWIYALPAMAIGLSGAMILMKFLLPALLFLLAYALARRLIPKEESWRDLAATAAGLAVTLGFDLTNYQYLFTLLHGGSPAPLLWTRPENPILGALILFVFLLALWQIWKRSGPWRSIPWFVIAGAVLACSIGYFFSLGMCFAILGALFVFAIAQKEYKIARELIYAGGISVLLDAWWWYNALFAVGDPALAARNGMFFTHAPVVNKILLLATLFVLASFAYSYFWRGVRERLHEWLFIFAMLAGSWIAFNQQVLTGREIWYQHFVQYTVPLSWVMIVAASSLSWRLFFPRLWRVGILLLCAASLGYGLFSIQSYVSRETEFAVQQEYAPVFAWLNTNAPHDCVVVLAQPDEPLERLIPAYTGCNSYNTTWTFAGEPQERILHNYLVQLRLLGVAQKDAHQYLLDHWQDVRVYFFDDWGDLFGSGVDPWVEKKIAYIETGYKEFSAADLEQELQKYRADYVVSNGPISTSLARELPGLHLLGTAGRFDVYSF